jgi:3-oxoadipate enol-lactonase
MTEWTTVRIGPAPFIAVDHAGSGLLVLFMHGIGGNRTNWHDQLPVFAQHFQAAAWDARGYGLSDDYDGPLAFGSYADDVIRVLDHFGAARAHLVGLSMGGRIAMDVAERYPDRLASLTLCNTSRGFAHFTEEAKREFIRIRKEPLVSGKEPRDIAPVVARTLVGPNASPAAYQRLVDSMSALHKESYIKSIEAMVMHRGADHLPDIRVPTHVVCGTEDRLTTPDMARGIAGQIPGARLTLLADAGHLSNIEQPAAFNDAVLGFLMEQEGAG